jgi:hypothetical protein
LATSEHHTWGEILDYYKDILKVKVKIISLATFSSIFGRNYQIKYDRMFNRIIDNSKVLADTGVKQSDFMPLYDGLKIELTNFSKNPQYNKIDENLSARIDELTFSPVGELKARLFRLAKRHYGSKSNINFKTTLGLIKVITKKVLGKIYRKVTNPIKERYKLYKIKRSSKSLDLDSNKKTVCILTIQGTENYGCILQNFSLQEFMKQWFNVYTLEVLPQYGYDKSKKDILNQNIYYAQKNQIKFVEKMIPRYPDMSKADIVVVGSDQVWHPFFNNRGKFWATGFKGKKIAYAASLGTKTNDTLPIAYKERIKKELKDYFALSTREPEGKEIVEINTGKPCEVVCDPVLLNTREFYEKLISGGKPTKNNNWFGYMIKEISLDKDLNSLAEKLNIKFNDYNMYNQVLFRKDELSTVVINREYPTVNEWLKQIRDSKLVFTSSFHSTVFSIIFHTDFFYIAHDGKVDARIGELLRVTGNEHRVLFEIDEAKIKNASPIEWEKVDTEIEKIRSRSRDWLKNNLGK